MQCLRLAGSQAFTEAVHAGDIFWHAMPFNTQVELLDAPLLQYAIEMTHELDDRFGQPPKRTMSQVNLTPDAILEFFLILILVPVSKAHRQMPQLTCQTNPASEPHWSRLTGTAQHSRNRPMDLVIAEEFVFPLMCCSLIIVDYYVCVVRCRGMSWD